jgi:signal transduction histidine kinase
LDFADVNTCGVTIDFLCNLIIAIMICLFGLFITANHIIKLQYKANLKIEVHKKEVQQQKKNFVLGFSHEIRNLINSMVGNLQISMMEIPIHSQVNKYLKISKNCADILLNLVNNILDSGKALVGEIEINITETNIHTVIENAWSICRDIINRKNLQGKLLISKSLPTFLKLDSYRIVQVLINLVINATKFTQNGGITIFIDYLPNTPNITPLSFKPRPLSSSFNKLLNVKSLDSTFSTFYLNTPFLLNHVKPTISSP